MRAHFIVAYCGNGRDVPPDVVSRHWTYSGALRAFKKRNWYLYDRKEAAKHGMANCGTFDRILFVTASGEEISVDEAIADSVKYGIRWEDVRAYDEWHNRMD